MSHLNQKLNSEMLELREDLNTKASKRARKTG